MRLFRAHGLGNDYLVLAEGPALSPPLIRAVCDRHRGVGSDGILEPVPARDGADFGLRVHNPDGSEAELSGNGLRIYAWWLRRARGAPAAFSVWTAGGVVRCEVDGERVRVAMGPARVDAPGLLAGVEAHRVHLGNPHAVVFARPEDWRAIGARVEQSVTGRTNVQFVAVDGPSSLRIDIWERGAGETLSSGSSACAAAAAAVATGRVSSPVTVHMEGGDLTVTVGDSLVLEGPVAPVGEFFVDAAWLRSSSR